MSRSPEVLTRISHELFGLGPRLHDQGLEASLSSLEGVFWRSGSRRGELPFPPLLVSVPGTALCELRGQRAGCAEEHVAQRVTGCQQDVHAARVAHYRRADLQQLQPDRCGASSLKFSAGQGQPPHWRLRAPTWRGGAKACALGAGRLRAARDRVYVKRVLQRCVALRVPQIRANADATFLNRVTRQRRRGSRVPAHRACRTRLPCEASFATVHIPSTLRVWSVAANASR